MEKTSKNKFLYIGVALLVVAASLSYRLYPSSPSELTPQNSKAYSSGRYGIAFQYPSNYRLLEKDASEPGNDHHVITLIDQANFPLPQNGEGPTAVTIDIFENDARGLSSMQFIEGSSYRYGASTFATSSYGQVEGIEYSWSGLYEGRSLVVSRPGYIFLFSVTRLNPDDAVVGDFSRILKTVVLK